MSQRYWLQKKHHIIQKITLHKNTTVFTNLPLQIFFKAVSPFSGPIALLHNNNISHHYILPKYYDSSIIIMSVKGKVERLIDFKVKDQIIYFGFLKYEELLVVDASGDFWIIDPFSSHIASGNFGGVSRTKNEEGEKQQRFRACEVLPKQRLLMLRQKNLGVTHSLHSGWEPLLSLKPSFDNPLFCGVGDQFPNIFIFLTKNNAIEEYDMATEKKNILCFDEYLSDHGSSLLAISYVKKKSLLGLVYQNPSKMVIYNTSSKTSRQFSPILNLVSAQEAILNQESDSQKKIYYKHKSIYKYKSIGTQIGWLDCPFENEQSLICEKDQTHSNFSDYLIFTNGQMILLSEGESFHMEVEKNILVSIEIDSLRVISESGHTFYRIVPYLYRLLVDPDELNQAHYHQSLLKYIEIRDQYSNYLNNKIVDVSKLNYFLKICEETSQVAAQITEEQEQQKQMIEQPLALSKKSSIQYNSIRPERKDLNKFEKMILYPLIEACRFCMDPVDEVKIVQFICFIKNYYESKVNISQICSQFRIINNLKFQYMNRILTFIQFKHLKYHEKQRFMTILLRYNMHYVADLIFKSTKDWLKIFLHWSKCKIQKNNEAVAFEEIKDKFQQLNTKNKNSSVFTDIAKYCMERKKFNLAQNFIDLQENPDHKIMIYLMLLNAKKQIKMVDKLLQSAQETSKEFLVYKTIQQLLECSWIETHIWVNILYTRPKVTRYYIEYLKSHSKDDLLKEYYLQQEKLTDLAYFQLDRKVKSLVSKDDIRSEYQIYFSYKSADTAQVISEYNDYKKLNSNLASCMKNYKDNQMLKLLRQVKNLEREVTIDQIVAISNDYILEYLGEILCNQNKEELGVRAIEQIKSDKVYNILRRKGRISEAMNLAFSRKNSQILIQIGQKNKEYEEEVLKLLQILKKHN